jgi:hypothetical protein
MNIWTEEQIEKLIEGVKDDHIPLMHMGIRLTGSPFRWVKRINAFNILFGFRKKG